MGSMVTSYPRRRKARSRNRLACGCVPQVGEHIILVKGSGWWCAACLLQKVRQR